MRNWTPDDAEEKAEHAFSTAQDTAHTAQNAICTGARYARENQIPVVLGAVLVGAVLGAFLASKRRKKADPVQTVREWLEKAQFSEQWPKAKKQARSIQDEFAAQARGASKKLHLSCR
jgi:hypothetical protein